MSPWYVYKSPRLSSSTNDVYIINNYLKAVTTQVGSPFVGRGNALFAVFFTTLWVVLWLIAWRLQSDRESSQSIAAGQVWVYIMYLSFATLGSSLSSLSMYKIEVNNTVPQTCCDNYMRWHV